MIPDMNELYHYGVKGQKWGVRRYQYADGSLTPMGKRRYQKVESGFKMKVRDVTGNVKMAITGKQYVDSFLKENTSFSRLQTTKNFENFAFYATYKKDDVKRYMGLFGKNLKDRANHDAKKAEKIANISGSETDIAKAKELREYSNGMKVYQLRINSTKKLRIPSDENAGHITANLLKDKTFKDNVIASISDSSEKMRRPLQQILFKHAQTALQKEPDKMTSKEKETVYKALNLSLVNHNPQEVAAQNRLYSELKKKGYNALLDYNDKEYSSYHAKRPMIVFDLDSVKLDSVTETNPKVVNKLYQKYNRDRIAKEIVANAIEVPIKFGSMKASQCKSYIDTKLNKYVSA